MVRAGGQKPLGLFLARVDGDVQLVATAGCRLVATAGEWRMGCDLTQVRAKSTTASQFGHRCESNPCGCLSNRPAPFVANRARYGAATPTSRFARPIHWCTAFFCLPFVNIVGPIADSPGAKCWDGHAHPGKRLSDIPVKDVLGLRFRKGDNGNSNRSTATR